MPGTVKTHGSTEKKSISREPLRQKGRGGECLPLKQHVGHGIPVEGEVERFPQAGVGGGRLRSVEAQGEKCIRRRVPDTKIFLAGFTNEVGRNVDEFGAAHLEIEDLAESGIAEGDFDGVEEWPASPGIVIGTE